MSLDIDHLLLTAFPDEGAELFRTLLQTPGFRLEQIVSNGAASAEGFWYDQDQQEWVLLIQGEAALKLENGEVIGLKAGDSLLIPAHCKHRVEYTSQNAVWLALHFPAPAEPSS